LVPFPIVADLREGTLFGSRVLRTAAPRADKKCEAASKQESLFIEALLLLGERFATIDQTTTRKNGIFSPFL
jgi:hypothetical protein